MWHRKFASLLSVIAISSFFIVICDAQQRMAPGVNPAQYQQHQGGHPPPPPPPQGHPQQFQGQPQQFQGQPQQFAGQPQQIQGHPQQFQGQPQQFQGQPQQFQGQPQQFQGQPQQFQGQPVQQIQGGHHHPQGQQQVLHRDMKHEKAHMKEHMEVPIDTSNMSEQELQFHYFKMHDADGNNKLDGCELVKSLIHWHEGDSHDDHDHEPPPHYEDEQLAFLVDPVLKSDDINNDGMIDYPEYIAAQIKNRLGIRETVEISV